jgi:hypothetical protein
VKPFYLSNRYTFQTQLVPLHRGGILAAQLDDEDLAEIQEIIKVGKYL